MFAEDLTNGMNEMLIKDDSLTPDVVEVIRHQKTEKPFSSPEESNHAGTYLCRACGMALFRSSMQFKSLCGWPSFDEIIENTVETQRDPDGKRDEIHCSRCYGHLGHVFRGEGFTDKNTRYCVNASSMDFIDSSTTIDTEEAIIAAGCFWGVQYYFDQLPGVVKTEVGYIGGSTQAPRYNEVCTGTTGHMEGVRVVYDISKTNYQKVIQYFFEIHDPEQSNGQGADIGVQYQSAIFYYDEVQHKIAQELKSCLTKKGFCVATKLLPVGIFWPAEDDHQHYYSKNHAQPYCHRYTKRF